MSLRRQHEYSARVKTLLSKVSTYYSRGAHSPRTVTTCRLIRFNPLHSEYDIAITAFSRALFTYPNNGRLRIPVFEPNSAHRPRYKAQSPTTCLMPSSPSVSSPPSSPIETAHDRSSVAAETPEQPQVGTTSSPTQLSGFQGRTNLESLLDDLDRRMMAENTASNDRRSPTTRRVTNNHVRVRVAGPDPIIAAPSTPRVVVPPPPNGGNQRRLSIAGRILVFFGYGRNNRARKELVSLICSLVVDSSQVSVLLACLKHFAPD